MLPSEALGRATTFDLYVLDISTRWLRHRQEVAEGKVKPKPVANNDLMRYMDLAKKEKQQQLKKLLEDAKE